MVYLTYTSCTLIVGFPLSGRKLLEAPRPPPRLAESRYLARCDCKACSLHWRVGCGGHHSKDAEQAGIQGFLVSIGERHQGSQGHRANDADAASLVVYYGKGKTGEAPS